MDPKSNEQIREMVQKSLLEGMKKQPLPKEPYSHFGFSRNPFSDDFPFVDPNFKLNLYRHRLVKRVVENIGVGIKEDSDKKSFLNGILIVGSAGSGKTLLLKVLTKYLDGTQTPEGIVRASYINWKVISKTNHFPKPFKDDNKDPLTDAVLNYENWLSKVEQSKEKEFKSIRESTVLFVDDAFLLSGGFGRKPSLLEFQEDLISFGEVNPLLICSISQSEFHYLRMKRLQEERNNFLSTFGKPTYFIPILKKEEIAEIVKQRIVVSSENMACLLPNTISSIADYSLGLPGLAMKLGTEALELGIELDHEVIESGLIDQIAMVKGFHTAYKVIEAIKNNQGYFLLSNRQNQVLRIILFAQVKQLSHGTHWLGLGVTTREVANSLGVNLSTASYHLKSLCIEKKILNSRRNLHDGRSTLYFVTGPVLAALELIIFDQKTVKGQIRLTEGFEGDQAREKFNEVIYWQNQSSLP